MSELESKEQKQKRQKYQRLHYLKNINNERQRSKEYHHKNKEKISKKSKEYRFKNRNKLLKYNSVWSEQNRDWKIQYAKEYYNNLRDGALEILGKICKTCGNVDIRCLEIHRVYVFGQKKPSICKIYKDILNNPDECKTKYYVLCSNCGVIEKNYIISLNPKGHSYDIDRRCRLKRKKTVVDILGGKCKKCGCLNILYLQIDHINGGGNLERLQIGNKKIYNNIINNPEQSKLKYQLLCANCNTIKKHENNETTKKYKRNTLV